MNQTQIHNQVKILLITPDAPLSIKIRDLLAQAERSDIEFQLEVSPVHDQILKEIEADTYHLCFLNSNLGQYHALELLEQVVASGCEVPIILLVGNDELDLSGSVTSWCG